jgi:hypothetical protein
MYIHESARGNSLHLKQTKKKLPFFSFTKLENRREEQVTWGVGTSGKGENGECGERL